MDAEADRAPALSARPALLLVALNLLLLPFALQGLHFDDTDTFYHLAGGRWMLEHHRLLDHESFSFTLPDRPWLNYYWLFQLLLAGAERIAGLPGVIGVRALFVLATGNLIALLAWRRAAGAPLVAAATTLLGLALYLSRALNPRPHLASHLLLVLLLLGLDRVRARRGGFDPWLAALFAAWANLHGVELPVGVAVVGVAALAGVVAGDSWLRWAVTLGSCVAAACLNPFGVRVLGAAWIGAEPEMMSLIDEMRPLAPASLLDLRPSLELTSQLWLNVAVVGALALLPVFWRARELFAPVLTTLAIALALQKLRFRPEAGLLLTAVLAIGLAQLRSRPLRPLLTGAVAVLLAAFGVTIADHARRGFFQRLDAARYPVAACRAIQQQGLQGRALVEPGLAGYVTWCAPQVQVFMDMRSPDPFGGDLYWLANAAGTAVPIAAVDARFQLDLVLLRMPSPAAERLLTDPAGAFGPVSVDTGFVLFAKRGTRLPFPRGLDGTPPPTALLRRQSEELLATYALNTFAHETLARLDLAEGRAAEALARVESLRAPFPRDPTWPWLASQALHALGRPADAERALREAHALGPETPRLTRDLAVLLLERGQPREAQALMEEEAKRRRYQLTADEYVQLGNAREANGRHASAVDAWERALWLGGAPPDVAIPGDVARAELQARLASRKD